MRKIQLQDTFVLARLIKKADLKEELVTAVKKGEQKDASAKDIGIDVLFAILEACGNSGLDQEFYTLLGGIVEKKPQEVKEQSIQETIEQIKQICEENDIVNFIKSAKALMK